MFEFELMEEEKIGIISNDSLLKICNEIKNVSVIVTNKRFLIFCLPKDEEAFRFGKVIDGFKKNKMELILEIPINSIIKINVEENFDKYFLKDTNYFYLCDDIIKNYLKVNVVVEEKEE